MKKVFGGYHFYHKEHRLNMNQLVASMKDNAQAYKEIQEAQATFLFANIVGGAGAFLIGWPLGTALAGGEPNWVLAGVGAGLTLVSIPISQKFARQARQAVNTYNNPVKTGTTSVRKQEFKFTLTGTGVGMAYKF
jgi:hypothetical protein